MTTESTADIDRPSAELATAWEGYCTELRKFGTDVVRRYSDDETDQAEGLRFALRMSAHLLDLMVDRRDPLRPEFWVPLGPTRRVWFDNPDATYYSVYVDPGETYRVTGTIGDAIYLAFLVNRSRAEEVVAGNVVVTPQMCDAEGNFELWFARDLAGRPGVALDDKCFEIVGRRYHKNRKAEGTSLLHIERVGGPVQPRDRLDPSWFAARLGVMSRALEASKARFEKFQGLREEPNVVRAHDARSNDQLYPTTSITYQYGWWDLSKHRQLRLTFNDTQSRYFSVILYNRFLESMEYRDRATCRNDSQLQRNDDGTYTVTISTDGTGLNALDATGFTEGFVVARHLEPRVAAVDPTAQLVS